MINGQRLILRADRPRLTRTRSPLGSTRQYSTTRSYGRRTAGPASPVRPSLEGSYHRSLAALSLQPALSGHYSAATFRHPPSSSPSEIALGAALPRNALWRLRGGGIKYTSEELQFLRSIEMTNRIALDAEEDLAGERTSPLIGSVSLIRRVGRGTVSFYWRYEWWLVAIVYIVALYLGFVGFREALRGSNELHSSLDPFYRALQLMGLQGGALLPTGSPVPWQLQVARFLVPLVTAYAALKILLAIFREQFGMLGVRVLPHRVVICGLGERGFLIARSQRDRGERVVVIEMDINNELIEPCRRTGAVVLLGDARNREVLRRARVHQARYVIAVCSDDRTNAVVAIHARELALGRTSGTLTCVVHVVDPQLSKLLKTFEIGDPHEEGFRLDCFNIFESGARALLREYPPFGERDVIGEEPHLVVIGLGRLGQSLLVQAARRWVTTRRRSGERLRVTVIDKQAGERVTALVAGFPQLSRACDLIRREVDVESPEFGRSDFLFDHQGRCDVTRIYVCLGDDTVGLIAALTLLQHLRERKIPVVVRMARATSLASLLEQKQGVGFETLRTFGFLDQTCDAELLLGGTYEILARATHEEYVRAQEEEGRTPETNPAMVPWDDLPEALKESNRDQASHIGVKLKAVGCGVIPVADWDEESFEFTTREIELLSEMEHERWLAERLRYGWTYASGTKDIEKKTSPYLVDWDELSEEVKEWDRVTVRGMPGFLARAEFQIVRLRPRDGEQEAN